ncbi:uncharacterized protein CBL_14384 [Carabus blaptoides fortunei]
MAFVIDKVSEDTFYENILIGLTKILDQNPRIKNVYLERQQACLPSDITLWEQLHRVKLPDDLKDFYLATNGFLLTWSYVFSEQETLPAGSIQINYLSDVHALAGYKICSPAEIKSSQNSYSLNLGIESKVFQLAKVDENTRVCLVYLTARSTPSIWLMDPELNWYYLCKNFTKYFCMNVAHLGLPLWQYCFTPYGVPSWVEQMFIMTTPHLPVSQSTEQEYAGDKKENINDLQNCHINKLDTNMFKPKTRLNSKSTDIFKYRKKP